MRLLHELSYVPGIPTIATDIGHFNRHVRIVDAICPRSLPRIVCATIIPCDVGFNPIAVHIRDGDICVVVTRTTQPIHFDVGFNNLPWVVVHEWNIGNIELQQRAGFMASIRTSGATIRSSNRLMACCCSISSIWITRIDVCTLCNIIQVACRVCISIGQFDPVIGTVHRIANVIWYDEILNHRTWTEHSILNGLNDP